MALHTHTHTMVVVLFLQYHTMIPLTPASSDHDTIPAPRLLHVSPAGNGSLQAPGLPAGNEISFYGICAVAGSYGVTGSCTFHKFLRGRRFLSVHIPQVPARSQVLVSPHSTSSCEVAGSCQGTVTSSCEASQVPANSQVPAVNVFSGIMGYLSSWTAACQHIV
jgi:hypothetical protein